LEGTFLRTLLARGNGVLLRDPVASDSDAYVYFMTHGEWRDFDAPWETDPSTDDLKKNFINWCTQEPPCPRTRALIVTRDDFPIGRLVRYGESRFPKSWSVGIDINDDTYLNRGLGTEALTLWIAYLFSNSDIHRIGLDTWSFNPRMAHVAGKLGFVLEGTQRGLIEWQSHWMDRL
jgi:RimJ/RimL family protein N-acetyltransferase